MRAYSVNQNVRDNFVCKITKTYWSKVVNEVWIVIFWNKNNSGLVNRMDYGI